MNEETMNAKGKLDLASFSDKELESLVPLIEKELVKRRDIRKKEALEKVRTIAAAVSYTHLDVYKRQVDTSVCR